MGMSRIKSQHKPVKRQFTRASDKTSTPNDRKRTGKSQFSFKRKMIEQQEEVRKAKTKFSGVVEVSEE